MFILCLYKKKSFIHQRVNLFNPITLFKIVYKYLKITSVFYINKACINIFMVQIIKHKLVLKEFLTNLFHLLK